MEGKVLALAGGVGGAKLVLGLSRLLSKDQLVVVVNTGDDEEFHGLHVSPDLDTVMYTLAGLSNTETGWGLAGDTFQALEMLGRYGAETWFNLGDRDLATHLRRTQLLRKGATLSQVTEELCNSLEVGPELVPMSDDPVRTVLSTSCGRLPMQQYFVQQLSEPTVSAVEYEGAESAKPSPSFAESLEQAELVVFCPSNPFLSLGPILAVPGVREELQSSKFMGKRIAVSPIIGDMAFRGPAAKIMAELGEEVSSVGVARQYRGLCDTLMIDHQDSNLVPAINNLGITPVTANILMNTEAEKVALARQILEIGGS
ncbi:MAG: 2-phospho-L-lactate transferase [Dehalococcoidia bacterium]